ncbi:MAG: phosphotransferase [Opitutaceae bacterium]|nr:phosphotransferase [Opitutaceae bacterium]
MPSPAENRPVDVTTDYSDILAVLRRTGLLQSTNPVLQPFSGGVSSDIVRVEEHGRSFVVKRALAKLKVKDDWFADVARNAVEQAYLHRVGALVPQAVPRLLHTDAAGGWFAMEYLGAGFENWKARLMRGETDPAPARRAGEVLGAIHRETWGRADIAREFRTWSNFHQLRAEPYLETTARRVPELAPELTAEVARMRRAEYALVHGDFSPKNLLVSQDRLVIVDAEVAWYGEPAFDTAFLLTHLHLKALVHPANPDAYLGLAPRFWSAYTAALGAHATPDLEARTVRLLLCLLLARVHGKSPAEYLTDPVRRDYVTAFVRRLLPRPPAQLAELAADWRAGIPS